jgi:hypothetical protein
MASLTPRVDRSQGKSASMRSRSSVILPYSLNTQKAGPAEGSRSVLLELPSNVSDTESPETLML